MLNSGKSLVVVYGALKPHAPSPTYLAVAPLGSGGETIVQVTLPNGVRNFPRVPFSIMVSENEAMIEYKKGQYPELVVTHWEPFYD